MRIAYLDCFSGVAGDMLLGALIDAGVDADFLRAELAKLKLAGVELRAERTKRRGIAAVDVKVDVAHDHSHRSLSTIERIIGESDLAAAVKERAIHIFRRLGEAEARVHAVDIEKVHFHEVGALDAIVDVVGAAIGFQKLGIEKLYCSPLNLGSGTVKAAHGVMPVPAPATALLVHGVPAYSDGPAVELTTPTGAAIVTALAEGFGPMPAMRIGAIGYGAGDNDFPDRANVVRLIVGESSGAAEATEVWVLEANLDDISPEWAGFALERLIEAGALDVTLTPVSMKKGRPGLLLSVIAAPADRDRLGDLVFAETTTLGLRMYPAQRRVLEREWEQVMTSVGAVRVKAGLASGTVVNAAPEYEDCRRLAVDTGVPLKQIWHEAAAAYERLKSER